MLRAMRSTLLAAIAAAVVAAALPAAASAAPKDTLCPMKAKTCDRMPWDRYAITGVYIDGETTAVEETTGHTFTMSGTTAYAAPKGMKGRFETVAKGLGKAEAKPVEIEVTSEATYVSGDKRFDCSLDIPKGAMPKALVAIAALHGSKVHLQWSFMPSGWSCGGNGPDSPITPTSPPAPKDLTTTVHDVKQFTGKTVKLKVRIDKTWDDTSGGMTVTQTWWGDVTLTKVGR